MLGYTQIGGIMKLLAVLLSLASALVLSASAPAQDKKQQKPFSWAPIKGYALENGQAFYDRNSIETLRNEDKQLNMGFLLTVFDNPVDIPTNNGNVKGASVLSVFFIDCQTGMAVKTVDIAFDKKLPTRKIKPIAMKEYDLKETIRQFDKTSPVYKVLCPIYI